ncbi:hypothetical protein BX667DRAFT_499366 [Coemansia mojavensis]|nr:hypothetical protein BX667DRAFT_499366 [Coemansia mojavensis]
MKAFIVLSLAFTGSALANVAMSAWPQPTDRLKEGSEHTSTHHPCLTHVCGETETCSEQFVQCFAPPCDLLPVCIANH